MNVKYLGILTHVCEVCGKYAGKHSYEWELLMKDLYPKDYKTKLIVCEKCAKRESGAKHWSSIRRGG